MSDASPPHRPSRHRFLLVLLALVFCLPSLFTRDLWNPDEPRYAEVAREMRLLDQYFVPHLNSAIYAEKPPLFFWLSALLQSSGVGFAAGRIVTAIAAIGTSASLQKTPRLRFWHQAVRPSALEISTRF